MSVQVDERAAGQTERQVRALVVDDEETILEFLGMGLGYEGFTVETATDGPAALAAADRFRPDVVLLDVMLPGLDGVEVCRRLRARGDVAIIMLTAKGETDERITGLDAGADDYVPSPFASRVAGAHPRRPAPPRHRAQPRLAGGDVTWTGGRAR